MIEATAFLPGLSPVAGKSLTAALDAGNLTSNGGLVALREVELKLGIADVIASPVPDARNRLLVTRTFADMVRARMMMIAAGHEACDDIDRLAPDFFSSKTLSQPAASSLPRCVSRLCPTDDTRAYQIFMCLECVRG